MGLDKGAVQAKEALRAELRNQDLNVDDLDDEVGPWSFFFIYFFLFSLLKTWFCDFIDHTSPIA